MIIKLAKSPSHAHYISLQGSYGIQLKRLSSYEDIVGNA